MVGPGSAVQSFRAGRGLALNGRVRTDDFAARRPASPAEANVHASGRTTSAAYAAIRLAVRSEAKNSRIFSVGSGLLKK